jgi:sec-independent protein translocase protein TatA
MFPFAFAPGPLEIIIVLVIVLLLFGAKRLPELGKSLGTGMREFKSSVTGKDGDDDESEAPRLESPERQSAAAPTDGAAATAPEPAPARSEAAGSTEPTRS